MGHNTIEVANNICYMKGKIDHSTITRWFKKLHSSYKNLIDQARSGQLKTMDSKAVL